MKFEKTEVFNFEGAVRGMRNAKESWNRMDSDFTQGAVELGPNDLGLAQRLVAAGPSHYKFLREIMICVDITAPLYWFKEFDTYKVGTTANSTSTMHKLAETPITLECFEMGDYKPWLFIPAKYDGDDIVGITNVSSEVSTFIEFLEGLRVKYLETKDKEYWKELIRWLPSSWMQTRTVTMSYANARALVDQRKNHKLTEWSVDTMDWINTLPYSEELIKYKL